MKSIFLTLILSFHFNFLLSQQVSGFVFAEDTKEPLLGVNIKAGAHGTISDIDGSFRLNITDGTKEIIFSFVGFKELSYSLEGSTKDPINIYLNTSNTFLETAVVTGSRYEKNISDSPVSISIGTIFATVCEGTANPTPVNSPVAD